MSFVFVPQDFGVGYISSYYPQVCVATLMFARTLRDQRNRNCLDCMTFFFLYGTLKACARTLFIRCGLPVCKCTCISDVNKLASLASVFCFSSCVAVASHHHLSTELTARRWVDYNLQRAGFQVYRSPGRITGRCAHDVPLLDLRL